MNKDILFIKHIAIEGPGSMAEFFGSTTWGTKTIDLSQGKSLPQDLTQIQAVVLLGGPMNVYEEDKFPFLRQENHFLRKVIEQGLPFLGICLGAQLLAKAGGARIKKASQKEEGWHRVNLNEAGKRDPLFQGLEKEFSVFQWHEDSFDIPAGGILLASSAVGINQAFRLGSNAYGLQFHIEVTPEMIEDWMKEYKNSNKEMVAEAHSMKKVFQAQANLVYNNFAGIIRGAKREVSCK